MSLSADKRHRQSLQRRLRNRSVRSRMRTEIRKFLQVVDSGDTSTAQDQLRTAHKHIDNAARKGSIPRGRAARTKSRLQKKLNAVLG